jgi:hypothetical protein
LITPLEGRGNCTVNLKITDKDQTLGNLINTGATTVADEAEITGADIMLGNDSVLTNRGMGGWLADVVILDKIATDVELQSISMEIEQMQFGQPGDMHAYYRMRGITPEPDLSGNENDLTLTGTERAYLGVHRPPIDELR